MTSGNQPSGSLQTDGDGASADVLSRCLDIQTLELIPDGAVVYSVEGVRAELLFANRAALDIFECESFEQLCEFCHGNYAELFHPEDYRHHIDTASLAMSADIDIRHHVQYRIVTRAGNIRVVSDTGRIIPVEGHEKCHLCILTPMDRDIQYSLSSVDKLTGLLGYGQFRQYCGDYLHSLASDEEARAHHFVYFNIRRFKSHNVEYGSKEGDAILKRLAEIIQNNSTTKIVARVSDDRFIAISTSTNMFERIEKVIDEFENEYGQLGLSLKVGIYRVGGRDQDCLIACDFAKAACDSIRDKKEAVRVYDESLVQITRLENHITQNLDKAIAAGHISVYYQPVVRTLTGEVCGMEALARWVDPEYGFLSPADFIGTLEANGLITKLDMHVLEKTCELIRDAEAAGEEVVPVSVNLSRHDFLDSGCLDAVEKIVSHYGVARDMINIEVTESIFMDNPDFLKREVARFRKAGYQVWMDDFGSGYSSLNLLKDYRFDEVKLDMRFLADLDDRSKKIIESLVRMAKEIGIQTLAEGVETQEHLDFLREIGCEKVQGYLFSAPKPYATLMDDIRGHGVKLEGRRWRRYHDMVGRVDFTTDRSLAIVEYDGKTFSHLFVNQPHWDVWGSLGSADIAEIERSTNEPSSPMGTQFRNLQRGLHVGDGPRSIVYTVRGQYVRLTATCLAEQDERSSYAIEIANLSVAEKEGYQEKFDYVLRTAYGFYNSLFLIDATTGAFETLIAGDIEDDSTLRGFFEGGKSNPQLLAEHLIHPMDREAYLAFADTSTVLDRLMSAPNHRITGYFRTKTGNGSYEVKLHAMLYVAERKSVVYCTRSVSFLKPGVLERIAPKRLADAVSGSQGRSYHLLSDTLMESQTLCMFWKDAERRFVGANRRFLETFGLSDLSEIMGKTDEDMGWHIEGEAFEDDEWRVLRRGKVILCKLGQCIIKGVSRSVIFSKEPVYEDGRIVGLVGFFSTVDDLGKRTNLANGIGMTDRITGLMSSSAVASLISRYAEGWEIRGENFAAIRITVAKFGRLSRSYGERISNQMLYEIGQMVVGAFGRTGTCARLFSGNFVVLAKCSDKAVLRRQVVEFAERLGSVHTLAGYPATLYPSVEVEFADERDMGALLGFAGAGTAVDATERTSFEERLEAADLQFDAVVDALPGGVILHEVTDDGNPVPIYVSKGMAILTGRSPEDLKAHLDADPAFGMVEKDVGTVRRAVASALAGTPIDVTYSVRRKDGRIMRLRMRGRQVGMRNGHPLMLDVFQEVPSDAESGAAQGLATISSAVADRFGQYLSKRTKGLGLGETSTAELHSAILGSIASTYIAMYLIDLEDDSFMKIACMEYAEKVLRRFTSAQEALRCITNEMISPESRNEARRFFDLGTLPERLRRDDVLSFDYNGEVTGWCRGQFMPLRRGGDGCVTEVLFIVQHIHADKMKEEKLREMSETDGLSQLYNRMAGESHINALLAQDKKGMFCLFDIDDFKHCNDTYGHAAGDEVIRKISACAKRLFREDDVLMRIGGDEFGVYSPTITDRELGKERVALLVEQVEKIHFGSFEGSVTVSAGTVFCDDFDCESFDQLYGFADTVMYSNKREKKRLRNIAQSMIPEQVSAAMMIYRADEYERIMFATRELIEMFECRNFEEFFEFTGGRFRNIVHPDDLERVEADIARQISQGDERKIDYVEYRSFTKTGKVKHLRDYGHLVNTQRFGDVFIVAFAEDGRS